MTVATETPIVHGDPSERTYHATTSKYLLPNDEKERDRLVTQHAAIVSMQNGRATFAPLSTANPSKILDIGCGPGAFVTLALAQQHPTATVHGIDLSPAHHTTVALATRAGNVVIHQGNFLEEATRSPFPHPRKQQQQGSAAAALAPGSFDHVFSRALIFAIDDWPAYFRHAHALLKPGGWVERQDPDLVWCSRARGSFDASVYAASDHPEPSGARLPDAHWDWAQALRDACEARGLDNFAGSRAAQGMREAGFVDVRVEEYVWPYTKEGWEGREELWPMAEHSMRTLGLVFKQMIVDLLPARGFSDEKVEELKERVERDFFGGDMVYKRWFVTVGRKPEE